ELDRARRLCPDTDGASVDVPRAGIRRRRQPLERASADAREPVRRDAEPARRRCAHCRVVPRRGVAHGLGEDPLGAVAAMGLVLRRRDGEPLPPRRARRNRGRGRLATRNRVGPTASRAAARSRSGHRKPAIVRHSRIAMLETNATPQLRRVKHGYTAGARSLAVRAVRGLARTRVTPNVLTTAGVSLCLAAAVLVPFEDRTDKLLVYWLAAAIFVVGSLLDIL